MNDLLFDFKACAQEEEKLVCLEVDYITMLQRQK